ncbi:hypothetical protein LINPERHAP1_LOCUS19431, partial [Linum perenne]
SRRPTQFISPSLCSNSSTVGSTFKSKGANNNSSSSSESPRRSRLRSGQQHTTAAVSAVVSVPCRRGSRSGLHNSLVVRSRLQQ